jgi:hypothetical protein
MVTRALDQPVVEILTEKEVKKSFDLEPMLWEGRATAQS